MWCIEPAESESLSAAKSTEQVLNKRKRETGLAPFLTVASSPLNVRNWSARVPKSKQQYFGEPFSL